MREDVLEGLPIGILIFDVQGMPVLTNSYAQQLCRQLLKTHPESASNSTSKFPQPIWRICQAVSESRELFPEQPVIIEDEIALNADSAIQIRARWLELEIEPYILVMLETQQAQQPSVDPFQLSEPDEVWLLQKVGYSASAIANQLNLPLSNVNQHLNSIAAKQKLDQWMRHLEP